jgi:hypothetical protein
MSYIEIKDCKKGYILKGKKNHKVIIDNNGKKIKGHYMVFLEPRTETDFYGVMITSTDFNERNIAMLSEHFLTHFSEQNEKCIVTYKDSHLVPAILIKVENMGPFIKMGEISSSGIAFIEKQLENKSAMEWEEYLAMI